MILLPRPFNPRGKTPRQFLEIVGNLPWFWRLGKPDPFESVPSIRLEHWDQIPWPEAQGAAVLYQEHGAWLQMLRAHAGKAWPESQRFSYPPWKKVDTLVYKVARERVDYQEGREPADHGPNRAVHTAGWVAATIGTCLELKAEIPLNALRQWFWYVAGHFPCAYEDGVESPGLPDSGIPIEQARLVIL